MIQVYYWPRELRLVMSGHAEHKGNWSPQVCAAASALFLSLCSTSNGFRKYGWCRGRYHLNEHGMGYIRIWAKRRYFKRLRVAVGMCVGGLLMLEEKHPHLVHVEVCTGIPFDDETAVREGAEGGVSYLKKFCYDMTKDRPLDGQKGEKDEN